MNHYLLEQTVSAYPFTQTGKNTANGRALDWRQGQTYQ
jgi:hypothetical protein